MDSGTSPNDVDFIFGIFGGHDRDFPGSRSGGSLNCEFSWRGCPFEVLELVVKLGFTFTAVMLTLVASLV